LQNATILKIEFAENFESGYISFKIKVLLAQARIAAGVDTIG
jgi:hypothetical protein